MHCEVLKKEKLKEEVVFIHLKGIYSSSGNTASGCQSTALDVQGRKTQKHSWEKGDTADCRDQA